MISDVAIHQPRHCDGDDAALAARVTESQLVTGIRTARAFSYRDTTGRHIQSRNFPGFIPRGEGGWEMDSLFSR